MKKKKQYAVKAQKKTKICIVYQNNAEEGDAVWPAITNHERPKVFRRLEFFSPLWPLQAFPTLRS